MNFDFLKRRHIPEKFQPPLKGKSSEKEEKEKEEDSSTDTRRERKLALNKVGQVLSFCLFFMCCFCVMSQKENRIFWIVTQKYVSEMKICITVRKRIEFLAY